MWEGNKFNFGRGFTFLRAQQQAYYEFFCRLYLFTRRQHLPWSGSLLSTTTSRTIAHFQASIFSADADVLLSASVGKTLRTTGRRMPRFSSRKVTPIKNALSLFNYCERIVSPPFITDFHPSRLSWYDLYAHG